MIQRTVVVRGAGKWIAIGLGNLPVFLVSYATRPAMNDEATPALIMGFVFFVSLNIPWDLLIARLAVEASNAFEQRAAGILAGVLIGAVCGFALGGFIYMLSSKPSNLRGMISLQAAVWIYLLLSNALIGGISALLKGRAMVIWVCGRCEARVWPGESNCPNCNQPLQPS